LPEATLVSATSDLVTYTLADGVATVTLDDGKANAMSPAMLAAIGEALDQAERDEAVVVLRGRPGVFSAGYDLKVFQSGDGDALIGMLRAGGATVQRLVDFPRPVLAVCTGHAMAQGAFTLLAADVRIGVSGEFRFGMNEVSIGLVVPDYAVELCRHRMSPTAFDLALGTGRLVGPEQARAWGILDQVAAPNDLDAVVVEEAQRLTTLVPEAHLGTKRRVRRDLADRLRRAIDLEFPPP
jgi:enoyl-CoA hydratase